MVDADDLHRKLLAKPHVEKHSAPCIACDNRSQTIKSRFADSKLHCDQFKGSDLVDQWVPPTTGFAAPLTTDIDLSLDCNDENDPATLRIDTGVDGKGRSTTSTDDTPVRPPLQSITWAPLPRTVSLPLTAAPTCSQVYLEVSSELDSDPMTNALAALSALEVFSPRLPLAPHMRACIPDSAPISPLTLPSTTVAPLVLVGGSYFPTYPATKLQTTAKELLNVRDSLSSDSSISSWTSVGMLGHSRIDSRSSDISTLTRSTRSSFGGSRHSFLSIDERDTEAETHSTLMNVINSFGSSAGSELMSSFIISHGTKRRPLPRPPCPSPTGSIASLPQKSVMDEQQLSLLEMLSEDRLQSVPDIAYVDPPTNPSDIPPTWQSPEVDWVETLNKHPTQTQYEGLPAPSCTPCSSAESTTVPIASPRLLLPRASMPFGSTRTPQVGAWWKSDNLGLQGLMASRRKYADARPSHAPQMS